MRYGRYLAGLLVLGIALLFSIQSEAAAKKTIYNSPYVSFSPDDVHLQPAQETGIMCGMPGMTAPLCIRRFLLR